MANYRWGKSGLRYRITTKAGKMTNRITSGAGKPTRRTATVRVGKNTYSSTFFSKSR